MQTQPCDPADFLEGEDAITAFLSEAQETGDAALIADTLGVVERVRGKVPMAPSWPIDRCL